MLGSNCASFGDGPEVMSEPSLVRFQQSAQKGDEDDMMASEAKHFEQASRKVFELFDANGDGSIDTHELQDIRDQHSQVQTFRDSEV